MSYPSLKHPRSTVAVLAMLMLAACGDNGVASPPSPLPVASVSVTSAPPAIRVGEQTTLSAQPKAANGEPLVRSVTWSSDNTDRATVSSSGTVTALSEGDVTIRATSEGKAGVASLTILAAPLEAVAEVRLSVDQEVVLAWNGSTTITAAAFDDEGNELSGRATQWHSSKPGVVSVSNGILTALSAGVANVSAIIDGVAASVGVRVMEAPIVSLAIEGSTGIEIGDVAAFSARITRADGGVLVGPVSWHSSNPDVVRVEHEDLFYATLSAISEGLATITISKEGVHALLILRVTPRPTHDLIFNRWAGSASEIFTLGLGSEGLSPVKLNAGNVSREPSPSPDGTQYVFSVTQPTPSGEQQNDLYVVNRNGLNMRWLTRLPGIEDQPEWSPDGSKILFRAVVDDRPDLYTINVDGTGLTNLTAGMPAGMVDKRDPTWSRDGSRIAFIGVIEGQHKVWTISATGTNARQVTIDAAFDRYPTFSPDGSQIAFSRYNTDDAVKGYDVMIVPSQGGVPVRLALPGDQLNPAWSPDGLLIAVNGSAVAGQGLSELWTLRPDGTGLRLRTVNPGWGGGFNPAWIAR